MTRILAIETSCDETAAAVVEDGRRILSNVVASQVDLHEAWGGVVPEVASRQHLLSLLPILEQAMTGAGVTWADLSAIGVTCGPGLAGALLVGVNAAKAIALAHNLPLVGVNHLIGHLYANWLTPPGTDRLYPPPTFPLLCLLVSGGHTELILMTGHNQFRLLGQTIDDAAGECFDKVARILGLGYPGGPAIQRAAEKGNPEAIAFPRAWLKGTYDFSFSGLKTAILNFVKEKKGNGGEKKGQQPGSRPSNVRLESAPTAFIADVAASFQMAVVDVLVEKTRQAAEEFTVSEVLLGGGVAANRLLRQEASRRIKTPVRYPPPALCTDNAAAIAAAATFLFQQGQISGLDLDVCPSLRLVETPLTAQTQTDGALG